MGDVRLRAFGDVVIDHASAYAHAMPMRTRTVRLGSRSVRLTVPARQRDDGIDLLDGFLEVDDDQLPDFELIFYDGQGPVHLPMGTWPSSWHGPLGVIRWNESAPYRMSIDRHTQTITVFHPGLGKAAVWIWDATLLPYWSAATSFRLALSWMADTFDGEFIHGAVLTRDDEGLLLVGPSGAGKSTAAFQSRSSGFTLAGDDFVLAHDGRVHPVYRRGKLHDASFAFVPGSDTLPVLNDARPAEKRLIDISSDVMKIPYHGVRLRGSITPIRRGISGRQRVRPGRTFRSLAPYSLSGLLGGSRRSLHRMARLVEDRPAWTWDIVEDFDADMQTLAAMWDDSVA